MQLNNIKDLVLKSLNKTGKQNQIISSIVYNSITNDFLEIKKIDIKPYIISTKIVGNSIILKTGKPIINTEILNLKDLLLKNIINKLNKLGINIHNLDIKLK